MDADFGNTLLYPQAEYFGLVVLRLAQQDKRNVLRVLESLIPKFEFGDEALRSRGGQLRAKSTSAPKTKASSAGPTKINSIIFIFEVSPTLVEAVVLFIRGRLLPATE